MPPGGGGQYRLQLGGQAEPVGHPSGRLGVVGVGARARVEAIEFGDRFVGALSYRKVQLFGFPSRVFGESLLIVAGEGGAATVIPIPRTLGLLGGFEAFENAVERRFDHGQVLAQLGELHLNLAVLGVIESERPFDAGDQELLGEFDKNVDAAAPFDVDPFDADQFARFEVLTTFAERAVAADLVVVPKTVAV